MQTDLIICDEDMGEISDELSKCANSVGENLDDILGCVNTLITAGSVEGAFKDSLSNYIEAFSVVKEQINMLAQELTLKSNDFLKNVEEKDKNLYDQA